MSRKRFIKVFNNLEEYESLKDSIMGEPSICFLKESKKTIYDWGTNYSLDYLTIEILDDGEVTLNIPNGSTSYKYSINNNGWYEIDSLNRHLLNINVVKNDKIRISCIQDSFSTDEPNKLLTSDVHFNVYGNVMSFLYGDDFIFNSELSDDMNLFGLFAETNVVSAENLILPSKKLTEFCYYSMFQYCTSLTTAPELPATTLKSGCYAFMFYGTNVLPDCSNIDFTSEEVVQSGGLMGLFAGTKVTDEDLMNILPINPETGKYYLPVTTLVDVCYVCMFQDCASLTTAPELPSTTLADGCYEYMFNGCTSLSIAPELPSTTLADGCYSGMFYGCTGLVTAPELPATTLATYCYSSMFYGCSSLTTAPELPATTLANNCYYSMFEGCSSLTTAPELRAAAIKDWCYANMFRDCSSLINSPKLSATTLAKGCYNYMFAGCTSLTIVPSILPATTLSEECYGHMFESCKSLTIAPELPSSILTLGCYYGMFSGCESLNYIKMLAINISASTCLTYWVNGVASEGTFVKHPEMTSLPSGVNGIPYGWDITDVEIDYSTQYLTIKSLEDDNQVSFGSDVMCSINDGEWNELTVGNNITINQGEYIRFKGQLVPSQSCYGIGSFSATKQYNVSGNIMSLLYSDEFVDKTDLSSFEDFVFASLFANSHTLVDASNLILPATTLADSCYYCMFYGCSSLTTAPELPATTLSFWCYYQMFYGCTSLTTAPELPATTLATYCYSGMLRGCSSLNYIKMLATNISATGCLYNWVKDVASEGTFVKHPEMTSLPSGVNGIPNGWIVINYGETNDPYNGHEYVDLGLPSGTKWAKCNVGANSETEAGLYFAWGETQGYTSEQVTNNEHIFDDYTYEFSIDGNYMNSSKYNDEDGETRLHLEDDAAHAYMGGEWRMPTKTDFEELIFNTTPQWTTVNKVNGVLFTSKVNDKSLFIPSAGYCSDSSFYYIDFGSFVWSSSLAYDGYSYALSITSSNINDINSTHRIYGQSIRGVIK